MRIFFSVLCGLFLTHVFAHSPSNEWYTKGPNQSVNITMELFLTSTCPHCQKADAFFQQAEKMMPWLTIHKYVINQDKAALKKFYERLHAEHINDFAVPAMFFCGSRWSGYGEANTTGNVLRHALTYCHQKIIEQGSLTPETIKVLQKWGNASQYRIDASLVQTPILLLLFSALMDGLSSCSLFCFAAFLSFLWAYPKQTQFQLKAAIVFLISLGFVHYMQQTHTDLYYQLLSNLKWFEIAVGVLLLLATVNTYREKQSSATFTNGFLMIPIVCFTVIAVQTAQQTCTFNMALIYEQWMEEQTFSSVLKETYIILYQLFYLLPLVIVLLLFLWSKRFKRVIACQRMLQIAGYAILLTIGLLLIIYPKWLANVFVSAAVLILSLVIGRRLSRSP